MTTPMIAAAARQAMPACVGDLKSAALVLPTVDDAIVGKATGAGGDHALAMGCTAGGPR